MRIGYFLSSEEWGPRDLVEQAVKAEAAGFDDLWISDHYHPWNDKQGHSCFVWSTIGAIAQATKAMKVTTAVTCPTLRIHPAIIAQAAATSAVLLEGRFVLGLGSGEALNELILGDRWPGANERLEMLEEAVEVIRTLWQGGVQAAGEGKLVQGGLKVCWGKDEARARRTVHELWPNEGLPGELAQILPTPEHFEQANTLVTEELATADTPCGPDVEEHVEAIEAYAEADFDELYVNQIGPDQDAFFAAYRDQVLPRLRQ